MVKNTSLLAVAGLMGHFMPRKEFSEVFPNLEEHTGYAVYMSLPCLMVYPVTSLFFIGFEFITLTLTR